MFSHSSLLLLHSAHSHSEGSLLLHICSYSLSKCPLLLHYSAYCTAHSHSECSLLLTAPLLCFCAALPLWMLSSPAHLLLLTSLNLTPPLLHSLYCSLHSESCSSLSSLPLWITALHCSLTAPHFFSTQLAPTLPTVWPEASMLGDDHLRKVVGYDFHLLRKKYDVQSMWGGRPCSGMATLEEPAWDQRAVFTCWAWSGCKQTSRIGQGMTWKKHCVLMETLRCGRLGRPLNQLRQLRTCSTLSVSRRSRDIPTCIPKSGRKNKSFSPPYTRIQEDLRRRGEKRGSTVMTMPWWGSRHAAV